MSKKDYVALAALIKELGDTLSDPTQAWDIALADFTDDLTAMLQKDNPRFDRQRFRVAAGMGPGDA